MVISCNLIGFDPSPCTIRVESSCLGPWMCIPKWASSTELWDPGGKPRGPLSHETLGPPGPTRQAVASDPLLFARAGLWRGSMCAGAAVSDGQWIFFWIGKSLRHSFVQLLEAISHSYIFNMFAATLTLLRVWIQISWCYYPNQHVCQRGCRIFIPD